MNKDPKFSAELHKLCGKLREGEITDAEAKRLNDLLLESKAARRFYRAFMALTSALETRVAPQDVVDPAHDSDTNIDVLFERLQEAEDNAEPDFSLLHTPVLQPSSPKADPGSLSSHDLAAVTGYALRLALTSKPAKRIYAYAGVAAVVLLAVTLINPWGGGEEHTPDPVADDTSEQPAGVLRVATLTAEHDAVWASDAPSTGDTLAPGQRLTLTAGFAEITTEEGAAAEGHLVISVLAGRTLESLRAAFPNARNIARVMPNTPSRMQVEKKRVKELVPPVVTTGPAGAALRSTVSIEAIATPLLS